MRKTDKMRLEEQRGNGNFENYVPWIKVHEFFNHGRSHRPRGQIVKRIYHLMSDLEFSYFIYLQQQGGIIDIHEQVPLLPLAETLLIADELCISHPPKSRKDKKICTSDFHVIHTTNGIIRKKTFSLKYSIELTNQRSKEKLEIEKEYWNRLGVEWYLITENSFDYNYYKILMSIYNSSFWLEKPLNLVFANKHHNKIMKVLSLYETESLNKSIEVLVEEHQINKKMLYCYIKFLILKGFLRVNTQSSIELFSSTYKVGEING